MVPPPPPPPPLPPKLFPFSNKPKLREANPVTQTNPERASSLSTWTLCEPDRFHTDSEVLNATHAGNSFNLLSNSKRTAHSNRTAAQRREDSLNETIKSLVEKDRNSARKISDLEETVLGLQNELAQSLSEASKQKSELNDNIKSLRTDHYKQKRSLEAKIQNLERSVQQFRVRVGDVNRENGKLNETIKNLSTRDESSNSKIAKLEETNRELSVRLAESFQMIESLNRTIRIHERRYQCEALYTQGRIYDATSSFLDIVNTLNKGLKDKSSVDWISEFTHRCVTMLEKVGDDASNDGKYNEAVEAYSTALSVTPSIHDTLLIKWVKTMLIDGSADGALLAAEKLNLPIFDVHRGICDVLEGDGYVIGAAERFRQMRRVSRGDSDANDEQAQWERGFRRRCLDKLKDLGDSAMNSKKYQVAIGYYSNALSLDPKDANNILVKCCKARVGLLEEALVNTSNYIESDPSSYVGYKRKHHLLHSLGRHRDAFEAFEIMLSRIAQSLDPRVSDLRRQYMDVAPLIRRVVEQSIRNIPRVLIDMVTGLLFDKTQQAAAFEELPIYHELRSSMITRDQVDYARIRREVEAFYRYVMLSHRWQPCEPTFQTLQSSSVYMLPASPTNNKLVTFCKLVRSHRFRWAWSDTCCVNQADRGVQQESVVAMFRWYRGSSLTIVHLLGVLSESQEVGHLWQSIWNTRGWTYQEYIASKVVQFYTEDWKPYLDLNMFNHKESPIVLSEMEQAMDFTTQALENLQPGLDRVREKLYLACKRQTTREEDIAYSLFGIFDVAIPVIYGEGNKAVRRLLEYVLTHSDDVTLLAWIGKPSSHRSYLPADLTVYDQVMPPHVPHPIDSAEMEAMVKALHSSSPDFPLTIALYELLYNLPPLSLHAGRLRLPGIVFPLNGLVPISATDSEPTVYIYHATTLTLGDMEIKTTDNLSEMEGLRLIHPWVGPLLDLDFSRGSPLFDLATRALRLVIRLRRPFGALLLAPMGRGHYRRVATDSLIMAQLRKETSLTELMDGIRTSVDIK